MLSRTYVHPFRWSPVSRAVIRFVSSSRNVQVKSSTVYKRYEADATKPAGGNQQNSSEKRLGNKNYCNTAGHKDAHNEEPYSLEHFSSGPAINNSLFTKEVYHISPAFAHADFDKSQLERVTPASHIPRTYSDRAARAILRFTRWSFDLVTGYKHPPKGEETNPQYALSKEKWLQRFVFLESIAGVPGMVGGMVRHLHSLRLLRRDRAWIETLLEEAYNERMHLLTFINLTQPTWMMRAMLLIAQGVFFNGFFVAYLLFPRVCHRFVGYLEEEAVVTYTRCINDMERGLLPDFASMPAPDIAIKYWNMDPKSNVKDLIYYVRADESKHREVNHTLGNLKQNSDPNPYALDYSTLPKSVPRPTKDLSFNNTHAVGWERDEIKL